MKIPPKSNARLRALSQTASLTRMARETGIDLAYLSRIFNGKTTLPLRTATRIADYLEIGVRDLADTVLRSPARDLLLSPRHAKPKRHRRGSTRKRSSQRAQAKVETARLEIYNILVTTAKARTLISYRELVDRLRSCQIHHQSPILADILDQISRSEYEAARGMLSAVVVRKQSRGYGIPGNGFFSTAGALKTVSGTRKDFWEREREEVYSYWK